MHMILVFFLLATWHANCFQIVSQNTFVEVVNGAPRNRHTTTVKCDETDVGQSHVFTVTGTGGSSTTVSFNCRAPVMSYFQDHVGYIPNAVIPAITKVCSTDAPTNTSQVQADNGDLFAEGGLGFENSGDHPVYHVSAHGRVSLEETEKDKKRDTFAMHLERLVNQGGDDVHPAMRRLLGLEMAPGIATSKLASSPSQSASNSNPSATPPDLTAQGTPPNPPAFHNDPRVVYNEDQGLAFGNNWLGDIESIGALLLGYGLARGSGKTLDEGGTASPRAGAAAVIGIGFNLVCGKLLHCFGSDGGSAKALKQAFQAIDTQFHNIDRELNDLVTWATAQTAFNDNVNVRFNAQNQFNHIIANEVDRNTDAIGRINDDILTLTDVTNRISNAVNENFKTTSQEIHDNAVVAAEIVDYVSAIHNETIKRFSEVVSSIVNTNRAQRNVDVDLYQLQQDVSMRRSLVEMYFRVMDLETTPTTHPFLINLGQRPISRDERRALQTLEKSLVVSTVYIQRAETRAGIVYNQQFALNYRCDPLYILENTVSGLSFQTMFDYMGPGGCYTSPTAEWECHCVIQVTYDECVVGSSAQAFPWAQAHTTDLIGPGLTNSTCALSIQKYPQTGEDTLIPAYPSFNSVLDNVGAFETFLQSFCGDADVIANPVGITTNPGTNLVADARVRIFASEWSRYADLVLDPGDLANVCDPDFTALFGDTTVVSRLAYNVYTLFQRSYQVSMRINLPALERQIYGVMGSHINYLESPFNSENQNANYYRCVDLTFARIGETKLKMYDMSLSQVIHDFDVSVNGHSVHTSNVATSSGAGSVSSVLPSSVAGGNVTVTSQVLLADNYRSVLPARFYRVGEWPASPNGAITYDIPFEEFSSSGVANARTGKVNYIFQGSQWALVNDSSPFSLTEWRYYFSSEFDATRIGASAHLYRRRLVDAGFGRITCDDSVNADDTNGDPVANSNWCTVLRYYTVQQSGTQLLFTPKSFEYEVTVDTPGGTYVQTVLSHCPDAYAVTITTGDATIIFNTSSPETDTLFVQVHDESNGANLNCILYSQTVSLSANNPLVVGPVAFDPDCGNLYINARPVDDTDFCYKAPGIKLDVSHVVSGGPGKPGPVVISEEEIRDDVALDLIDQLNSQTFYNAVLEALREQPYVTEEHLQQQIENATQQRINDINKIRNANDGNEAAIKSAIAKIQSNSAAIQADILANRNDSQRAKELIEQIATDNEVAHNLTMQLGQILMNLTRDNNITQMYQGVLDYYIQQYLDSNGAGNKHCSFPSFLSFLCSILSGIGGIFGDLLQVLVHILVFVLVIWLAFKCLEAIVKGCFSVGEDKLSSGVESLFKGSSGSYAPASPDTIVVRDAVPQPLGSAGVSTTTSATTKLDASSISSVSASSSSSSSSALSSAITSGSLELEDTDSRETHSLLHPPGFTYDY